MQYLHFLSIFKCAKCCSWSSILKYELAQKNFEQSTLDHGHQQQQQDEAFGGIQMSPPKPKPLEALCVSELSTY